MNRSNCSFVQSSDDATVISSCRGNGDACGGRGDCCIISDICGGSGR